MSWNEHHNLSERFGAVCDQLQALFPRWKLGSSYSGWSEALLAKSAALRETICVRLREQMERVAGRHWRREGWLAFAVDGTRIECPRTAENERALGCAGKKRTAPQVYLTTLYHMGLGLPWSFREGPGTDAEQRHLASMLDELPEGSLLVADAGFSSYDLCRALLEKGHHFLLRVGGNRRLLTELGYSPAEDSETVYLWPDLKRRGGQTPLVLRLVVLREGEQTIYLITSAPRETLSQQQASRLYRMRWGVEVFFRSFKQTLERRTMKSRTPRMARCETIWTMIGLWLMGLLSVQAILAAGEDPLRWSVAKSRTTLRRALRALLVGTKKVASLSCELTNCLRDNYQRRRPKQARHWPHKKREKPPGPPKIRTAKMTEIQQAKQLTTQLNAA